MPIAYGASQYRQADVLGASPVRLVVMAYDVAIVACQQKDQTTAMKAVSALRDALDFDYPEISGRLFAIYNWILDCVRSEDYDSANNTLIELREAWSTIEKRLNASGSVEITHNGISPSLGVA